MSSSREKHDSSLEFVKAADAADPLRKFRSSFHFPEAFSNLEPVYLTGNSLGLMPKKARAYVDQELDDWARSTLQGIHLIASAYGWTEEQILQLSARRRQAYVEMIR